MIFHGILPQMLPNLYKSFTSDPIKLSQKKKEFLALRAFRSTLSWRYIIVVSFISIAFVSFKLKNFPNFAYRFSIHERALFGRFLGPYSPSMVRYYRKSHQRQYSRKQKYCLKNFWWIQVFMEKGRTQS